MQMSEKELRQKIWQLWGTIEKLQSKKKEVVREKTNVWESRYYALQKKYNELALSKNERLIPKREIEINPDEVITFVGEYFGVDPFKNTREKTHVKARHIIFYILYYNAMSLSDIGKMFGKDHSTVIHGRNRVASDMINYPQSEQDFINKMIQ